MKTIKLSSSTLIAVVLFLAIALSACKKEPAQPPKKTCDFQGYFVKAHGFDGYYGEYAIRLEDGTLLYPCIVEGNTINKNNINEEAPITVSFTPLSNEEVQCSIPYDPLFLPKYKMYRAKITCIGEQELAGCGTTGGGWCGTER